MKNIYMVQPNSQYGNSIYFPYAAGTLTAYAFSDKFIADSYDFKGFIYKKEDIDFAVEKLEDPFFVGFSCYVWNYEYNKVFAEKLKKKHKNCIIAFGGHQINDRSEIIDEDYVDIITLGEGEDAFLNILSSLAGRGKLDTIPNIIYKKQGSVVRTERREIQIPNRVSPYLGGWFDDLIDREKLEFSAIIETNRGCPNNCAFCDWGNIKARVKLYDLDMIKGEIDWMSEHKIEYCYSADANFGLFPRDREIVEYFIKKHNENGYPQKFQATYSKSNPETVFEINKRLNEAGMSKGATLSFQSMDEGVLKNIGRENMPISLFKNLMDMYNDRGISAYSEIIIGLPGETYGTMRECIETLLECGQHTSINFFNCELLNNSRMSDPAYMKKFSIVTAKTEQHQYHIIPSQNSVKEYSNIVISTLSMPKEMWIETNIMSVFVRTFHNLGLIQCVAIYLYYEKGIKYMDFYDALIAFAVKNPGTVIGGIYSFLKSKYTQVTQSKGSLTCVVKEFGKLTWPLEEGSFLKVVNDYFLFFDETEKFLSSYFDDKGIFKELLAYQKAVVKIPYKRDNIIDLDYDFYAYFSDIYAGKHRPLEKKKTKLYIDDSDVSLILPEYAVKTIWYGRRGGKNIVSHIKYL